MKLKNAKKFFFALTLSWLLSSSFGVNAKVIELPYLKFNLPDTWVCKLEKTETVCKSSQDTENKQAVVLINAKETTPAETLESFYQQLSKSKGLGSVKKIEYVQINNIKWIQSHHSGSELPNYETIYWMTRVQNIAILVSYSFISKFSNTLYPLAQNIPKSFKLNLTEIARLSEVAQTVQVAQVQPTVATDLPKEMPASAPEQKPKNLSEKLSKLIKSPYAVPLIVLCVIMLLFMSFIR